MRLTPLLKTLVAFWCACIAGVALASETPEMVWARPDTTHGAYRLAPQFRAIAEEGEEAAVAWALSHLDSEDGGERRAAQIISVLYLDPGDIPLLLKEHSRAEHSGAMTYAGIVVDRMIYINRGLARALPDSGGSDSERTRLLDATLARHRGVIGELMNESSLPLMLFCQGVDPAREYSVDGRSLEWRPDDWPEDLDPEVRERMLAQGMVRVTIMVLDLHGLSVAPEYWHDGLETPPVAVARVGLDLRPYSRSEARSHGYGDLWAKYGDEWVLVGHLMQWR